MSKIEVDKVDPQSGTALEIGTSGDTVTVPSGVTLTTTNATVNLPASVGGLGTGITNAQLAGSIDVTSKITGVVPTANLGSGSASSSTILYGDQTYKAEPAGGAWNLQATETASGASSVEFVHGASGVDLTSYKFYKIVGVDIVVSDNDSKMLVRYSDDTGVSYESTNYQTTMSYTGYGDSPSSTGTTTAAMWLNNFSNTSGYSGFFEFTFCNPSSTTLNKLAWWVATMVDKTPEMRNSFGGGSRWDSNADVDAVQVLPDGGTFSGVFKLYGIS